MFGSSELGSHDCTDAPEYTPVIAAFLEGPYLDRPYLVAPDAKNALVASVDRLGLTVPGFGCVVNVGGTANGSLLLRRLERVNAATDLDIYFVGHSGMLRHLSSASYIVAHEAQCVGLVLDGELNGKKLSNFLNLDDIEGHIAREEFNLLALPFQSAYGDVATAQKVVLEQVIARPDKQQIWDEIASCHAQSLSLHHGSLSSAFSNLILQQYYPRKVARFELPEMPDEALVMS